MLTAFFSRATPAYIDMSRNKELFGERERGFYVLLKTEE